MPNKFFVGDLVKTKEGVGRVVRVNTWRDRLITLEEYEVDDFLSVCKAQVGFDFKEKWTELLVLLSSGKYLEVQAIQVEILEGRDDCENTGLETFATKKSKKSTRGEQGQDREGSKKKASQSRRQRFSKK
jgi:hypothetical protein